MQQVAKQTSHAKKGMRSCIVCGANLPKRGLMRVVRSADGSVAFDATGKSNGRGAYVCSAACLDSLQPSHLQRALKTKVSVEDVDTLRNALTTFVSLSEK